MSKPASRQRRPRDRGELLDHLRGVVKRLDPQRVLAGKGDALSAADRAFAATVLSRIFDDNDPREYFWETINHPVGRDDGLAYSVAFVYHAKIALGEAKAGKVLRAEIERRSGLKDAKIEHAVRPSSSNTKNAKAMIAALITDRRHLIAETNRHLLRLSSEKRREK